MDEFKQNPSAHFESAQQVLADKRLTQADKIEVLTNWANEIRQLQVAEEESMTGSNDTGDKLTAIEQALLQLGAEGSGEHDAKA